jgi:hypothetical protein
MKRSTLEKVVNDLIKKYPDELEAAFVLAATFGPHTRDLEVPVSVQGHYALVFEGGPGRHPVTDSIGYWALVKLYASNPKTNHDAQPHLGGVWGEPCRRNLSGVTTVEYEALKDFLVARGWVFHYFVDHIHGEWLLSPPGVQMVDRSYAHWEHEQKQMLGKLDLSQLQDLATWAHQEALARSLESL